MWFNEQKKKKIEQCSQKIVFRLGKGNGSLKNRAVTPNILFFKGGLNLNEI